MSIRLADVLAGNRQAIAACASALRRDGWCHIEMTSELADMVRQVQESLVRFFDLPPDAKIRHSEPLGNQSNPSGEMSYGYYRSGDRKEGLRLLSGLRMKELWVPLGCSCLEELNVQLHEVLLRLCEMCSPVLFGMTAREVGQRFDIPLLFAARGDGPGGGACKDAFAMLDLVKYSNVAVPENGMNCEAHFDPGLLSLSVLSSQPGLQLCTGEGRWVDGPGAISSPRVAVLWAGEAAARASAHASGGPLRPAVHRVLFPSVPRAAPRLAVWMEVVTRVQDLAYSANFLDLALVPRDMELVLPSTFASPSPASRPQSGNLMFNSNANANALANFIPNPKANVSINVNSDSNFPASNANSDSDFANSNVNSDSNANSNSTSASQRQAAAQRAFADLLQGQRVLQQQEALQQQVRRRAQEDFKPALKLRVYKGESLLAALQRASRALGVPLTKSITFFCPLCAHAVGSLEEHFKQRHGPEHLEHVDAYLPNFDAVNSMPNDS